MPIYLRAVGPTSLVSATNPATARPRSDLTDPEMKSAEKRNQLNVPLQIHINLVMNGVGWHTWLISPPFSAEYVLPPSIEYRALSLCFDVLVANVQTSAPRVVDTSPILLCI